jgi:hypothetical protein
MTTEERIRRLERVVRWTAYCFAVTLCTLVAACASGPEWDCAPRLASGMTLQEVGEVLARDPSLTQPMTFVRNTEGKFTVEAPGLPGWTFWVQLPEHFLAKQPKVYAQRIRTIEARQVKEDIGVRNEVLYTYYDADQRLVLCHEAHYDMHNRPLFDPK